MSQDKSLLHHALEDAHLTTEAESEDFWQKPLGKNAKSKEVRQQYIKDSEQAPLNRSVIFYETMSGARMGDNPYGIFEYLRAHPEFGTFLHVWSIDARGSIPKQYEDAPDIAFARRNTRSYTYFLASAGYVVCNANLPGFFTRRADQKYLNTWHGIPYKALGRNTPTAKFGSPAGNATFTKATHILTPCEFTSTKIASAYSLEGISNATIAETGYPRIDRTVAPQLSLKPRLQEALGLQTTNSAADYRPTVLYAPTWRSENDKDVVDSDQLMEDLGALAGADIQLMYRGHHRMDRLIKDASVGDQLSDVIIPPHEISSNDLLTVVDILITDFSSIFFDFLPTGRPVVHYLYDLEEYASTRGLNLETEELPGTVALTRSELVDAVTAAAADLARHGKDHDFSSEPLQGERYKAAKERFCLHEDGHASKRAVEFLIEDKTDGYHTRTAQDGRPTAAFWAGELKSGPKSEDFLKSLLQSAASPLEQTVLIVEKRAPIDKPTMKRIKDFGDAISTFSYEYEQPILLPKEEPAYRDFASQYYLNFNGAKSSLRGSATLRKIYSREYRRRIDDARFDRVFLASDLSNDELALASLAGKGSTTTANKWNEPQIQNQNPKDKAIALALPMGSARRRFVARAYRELKQKTSKLKP